MFDKWLSLAASPHSKLGKYAGSIVQNDMEIPSEELNKWFQECGELIDETEQHFAEVIVKMRELRNETVKYIKYINN